MSDAKVPTLPDAIEELEELAAGTGRCSCHYARCAHDTFGPAAAVVLSELRALRSRLETLPPWEFSKPPTTEEMNALRTRWSMGPEKYQADFDMVMSALAHALDRADTAERALTELQEAADKYPYRGGAPHLMRALERSRKTSKSAPPSLVEHVHSAMAATATWPEWKKQMFLWREKEAVMENTLVDGWEVWEAEDTILHWFLVRPGETLEQAMKIDKSLSAWNETHDTDPPKARRMTSADLDRVRISVEDPTGDRVISLREAAELASSALRTPSLMDIRLIASAEW